MIIEPNCKASDRTISAWLSMEYCYPHMQGTAKLCVLQAFISLHLQEKDKKTPTPYLQNSRVYLKINWK